MRDGERGHRTRFRIDLGSGVVTLDEITEASADDLDAKIIELLRAAAPSPLSKNTIAEKVRLKKQTVLHAVDLLREKGLIKEVRGGFVIAESTVAS